MVEQVPPVPGHAVDPGAAVAADLVVAAVEQWPHVDHVDPGLAGRGLLRGVQRVALGVHPGLVGGGEPGRQLDAGLLRARVREDERVVRRDDRRVRSAGLGSKRGEDVLDRAFDVQDLLVQRGGEARRVGAAGIEAKPKPLRDRAGGRAVIEICRQFLGDARLQRRGEPGVVPAHRERDQVRACVDPRLIDLHIDLARILQNTQHVVGPRAAARVEQQWRRLVCRCQGVRVCSQRAVTEVAGLVGPGLERRVALTR